MPLDLLPRLLVHHTLGDFVVDPWTDEGFDLSRYGVTGYNVDLSQGRPRFTIRHVLGDLVLDPLGDAPAPDLTPYGITGYEVVFGPPPAGAPDLADRAGTLLGVGVVALAAWWGGRR